MVRRRMLPPTAGYLFPLDLMLPPPLMPGPPFLPRLVSRGVRSAAPPPLPGLRRALLLAGERRVLAPLLQRAALHVDHLCQVLLHSRRLQRQLLLAFALVWHLRLRLPAAAAAAAVAAALGPGRLARH